MAPEGAEEGVVVSVIDSRLVLRQPFKSSYYTIELADHPHRRWVEQRDGYSQCMWSGRIAPDSDVEGDASEMREIAAAIRERGEFQAKRCAVLWTDECVEFWSPRNSESPGLVSHAAASALADEIDRVLS